MSRSTEPTPEFEVWKCPTCGVVRTPKAGMYLRTPCIGSFERPHRSVKMFLRGVIMHSGAYIEEKVGA